MSRQASDGIISRKAAEIAFALLLLAFGTAIVSGALELETGWGSSGPEAGYFPFRVGILIMAAAFAVLVMEAARARGDGAIINRAAARNMVLFAVPLAGLAAAVPLIGVYLAAVAYLLIAVGVIGRAGWRVSVAVALLAPSVLFLLFEFIFRSPLPKGPLGRLLGLP